MARLLLTNSLGILALLAAVPGVFAQDAKHAALKSEFGTYGDNGLPFFGQTLDARKLGGDWPKDNLTPRGIILRLSPTHYACFDPDLLRIALVWEAKGLKDYLSMNGMAPGSYRQPHRKASAGQNKLPTPIGSPWLPTASIPVCKLGRTRYSKTPGSVRSIKRNSASGRCHLISAVGSDSD